MKVQAEVSLYQLRTMKLSGPVVAFCHVLRSQGLDVQTRSMSTFATGDSKAMFKALSEGFTRLAQENEIVMDVKVSNACPDTAGQKLDAERVD